MADDRVGPAIQRMGGQVKSLDSQVANHKRAFGSAMAANRQSAFSFGDGLEQVAGRMHPALGGIVSEVRKIATSLMSARPQGQLAGLGAELGGVAGKAGSARGGMGGLLGMLTKMPPQAAAVAAGLALIAGGLTVATMEAAKFEHTFRELSNLNLDRTASQIGGLRDTVLQSAFDKGIDPSAMSKGFFDFQSITGKFGAEVEQTGLKVADFSKAYIVDFNKQLEGTGQAMKSFGFGAEGVDRFLASTVKTVQTGKTTFEQLSQVRSEYFDSAAGAGFDFEGADKLFAAYSVGAKSVDVAATQVKETFRGLSDGNVIKGLKAQGVDVFDPLTHRIKTMDEISKGLVDTFSTSRMSDEAFAKIKSSIGGGDGIAMLLNKARAQGEGFLQVFRDFDATPVNMKAALAGANKDLYTMWDTVKAKLSVSLIRIGTQILPHVVSALTLGLEVVDAFSGKTEGISTTAKVIVNVFKGLGAIVWAQFMQVAAAVTVAIAPILLMIATAKMFIDNAGTAYDLATGRDREEEARQERIARQRQQASQQLNAKVAGMADTDAFRSGKPEAVLAKILDDSKGTAEGMQYRNALAMGGTQGRDTVLRGIADNMKAIKGSQGPGAAAMAMQPGYIADVEEKKKHGGKHGTSALGEVTAGGGGTVLAEGRSVRNISVSIQQLVGEVHIHAASVREGAADITREVERAMMAAVQNAEISMGQ